MKKRFLLPSGIEDQDVQKGSPKKINNCYAGRILLRCHSFLEDRIPQRGPKWESSLIPTSELVPISEFIIFLPCSSRSSFIH